MAACPEGTLLVSFWRAIASQLKVLTAVSHQNPFNSHLVLAEGGYLCLSSEEAHIPCQSMRSNKERWCANRHGTDLALSHQVSRLDAKCLV